LPYFKESKKPFMLLYWSSDPDGTQHSHRDSVNELVPGINGPTSLAAIKLADADLAAIMATLRDLGLEANTNIFVTADHGFSTISKQSKTSPAAKVKYEGVPEGQLPPGFLAIDLDAQRIAAFAPSRQLQHHFRQARRPGQRERQGRRATRGARPCGRLVVVDRLAAVRSVDGGHRHRHARHGERRRGRRRPPVEARRRRGRQRGQAIPHGDRPRFQHQLGRRETLRMGAHDDAARLRPACGVVRSSTRLTPPSTGSERARM